MNKKRRFLAGLAALSLGIFAWSFLPHAEQIRRMKSDYRFRYFNRTQAASKEVLVVDIDEQSLKLMEPLVGRWPWPRYVYKDLLEFLYSGEMAPKAVLFDVLFPERVMGNTHDRDLALVSAQRPGVSHAANLLETAAMEIVGATPLPDGFAERFELKWAEAPLGWPDLGREFRDYAFSLFPHWKTLGSFHVVTFQEDPDGVFRRCPLLFRYGDHWYPSLALRGALSTFTNPVLRYRDRILWIEGDGRKLPIRVDDRGQLEVNYYRRDRGPDLIPIGAVLAAAVRMQRGELIDSASVRPEEFRDRIVVIGASAAGLEDLKATPIHSAIPGSLIQATAISNILEGNQPVTAGRWMNSLFIFVCVALVYGGVHFIEHVALRVLLPAAATFVLVLLAGLAFRFWNVNLDLVGQVPLCLVAFLDGVIYLNFVEGKEKRQMMGVMRKYLSPHVARQALELGEDPSVEVGRHVELTILFTDIRGFTSYSEQRDPREVVRTLNAYLKEMTDVVFEHSGTLDKFLGDGMLAFWGAPLAEPRHAERAVRCALEMQRRLAEWRKSSQVPFQIGIGIHTGKAVVGNIGSNRRIEYTVIGDTVNLASRIEGATKALAAPIVISGETWRRLGPGAHGRSLGFHDVKGREGKVELFEPTGLSLDGSSALTEDGGNRKTA